MARSDADRPARRGALFVISAPSGAGKTTLVNELVARDPLLQISISHTTRSPRQHEKNGVAYHFVDDETFVRMVDEGAFLEHARVFDHRYGTSRDWVESRLATGKDVILEIDWQGARQIRAVGQAVVSVFVLPPSLDVLRDRLRGRGDSEDSVARRMRDARTEIGHFSEYDYIVVNDDRAEAIGELEAIVRASRSSCPLRRKDWDRHVSALLQAADPLQ
jgi:guanylate kinase